MKGRAFSAAAYDGFMLVVEFLGAGRWRRRLWEGARGPRVLEAGVGTGLNVRFYGPDLQVVALDRSARFLERARRRARRKKSQVVFVQGDVYELPFDDASFDSAVTTFLFCQLENPARGLGELHRVLKPGGRLLMLEHVRSDGSLGRLMDLISGPLYRLTGDNIARDTSALAARAGFMNVAAAQLFFSVIKMITAEKDGAG